MRVGAAQINPIVGDLSYNRETICRFIDEGKKKGLDLLVFPEMALTGYPPEDLLLLPAFVEATEKELGIVAKKTKGCSVVIGTVRKNPHSQEKGLHNTAAVCVDGEVVGFQDKTLLPDYDVFSERRYFEPAEKSPSLWNLCGGKVGITICEDIWQEAKAAPHPYRRNPVHDLEGAHPDLLLNLSSSPYALDRPSSRIVVGQRAATRLHCPLLFCNQVGGNDSLLFDGHSYYLNAGGELIAMAKGFEEDLLVVETEGKAFPFSLSIDPMEHLFSALVMGVRDYLGKVGLKKALLGLSGGIDSAVCLCIAVHALGEKNVQALFMPSRYTSQESREDAVLLARKWGVSLQEISIEGMFATCLETLAPPFKGTKEDCTEENLQARLRGMLLMAFSNKFGPLVLNTGNKSEIAMGYTTLYGDSCGGLAVLGDVTKEQVYALARWINREQERIPERILKKAPSAELRFNQKDSDTMPEYAVIDRVIEGYVEGHLSAEEIARKEKIALPLVKELIKRIHLNEYKRRQSPPPLRVTRKAFTAGRRFPIVQRWNL